MKCKLSRTLVIVTLTIALIIALSTAALAAGSPKYIYYQNQDDQLVMADFKQAVADLQGGDAKLRDAIKLKLATALQNFKAVYVEDEDGTVVNYATAVSSGLNYLQAYNNPVYHAGPQTPVKQLVINSGTGLPEEVALILVSSVTAVNGTITAILNTAPTIAPVNADFTITQSIGGGAATTVTPTAPLTWTAATRTVVLTVPLVTSTGVDQSVVMSAAYKNSPPKSATAFIVPGNLAVESITALNLKQLEVKFNMPVKKTDAETVVNYTVLDEGVNAKAVTHAVLQADEQTVLLTISGASIAVSEQLSNLSQAKVTVSKNVVAVNNQAMTADYVAEQVAVSDLTVPSIAAVQQKAPNMIRVIFSEPIKDVGPGNLTVESANFLINDGALGISAVSDINIPSRYVDITTAAAMTAGSYILKVNPTLAQRNIEDFAGWKIPLASTFTFTYVPDTEPPVAVVKEISQTAVTYKFNKVVTNADNNNVRYRHSVNTAAYELRGNNVNVSVVNPADGTGTEVTVNYNAAGIPLPTGTVTLYISYEVPAGTLIRDAYNNAFVAASFTAQVAQDTEPPTATVTVVSGFNNLIDIQYSKAVDGGTVTANYTLKKGAANVPFTGPVSMGANKYRITATDPMQGAHTLTIKNITDTAVVPNEMPETTFTFNVTDTIPPEITLENNVTIGTNFFTQAGDNTKVRVFFSEAMNATDLADKTNYFNVADSSANPTTATPAVDAKSVYLVFANGVTGNLEVKSMRDASGNFMTGLGRTLTTAAASQVGLDTAANVKAPTGAISTTLDKVTIYLNRKVTGVTTADFEVNPDGVDWEAPASVSVDNSGVNSVITLTMGAADEIAQDRWDTAAPQVRSVSAPNTQGDTAGAKDAFNNPVNFIATNIADGVVPVLAAIDPFKTADINSDGQIDHIIIEFAENIKVGSVSLDKFTVAGYVVSDAYAIDVTDAFGNGADNKNPVFNGRGAAVVADSKYIVVRVTQKVTPDTDAIPSVTISSGLKDMNDNTFTGTTVTAKDGAAPALVSWTMNMNLNGHDKNVVLTFSEPVLIANVDLTKISVDEAATGSPVPLTGSTKTQTSAKVITIDTLGAVIVGGIHAAADISTSVAAAYTIVLNADALEDAAGNKSAAVTNFGVPTAFTADTTDVSITGITADQAAAVATITVTFNDYVIAEAATAANWTYTQLVAGTFNLADGTRVASGLGVTLLSTGGDDSIAIDDTLSAGAVVTDIATNGVITTADTGTSPVDPTDPWVID